MGIVRLLGELNEGPLAQGRRRMATTWTLNIPGWTPSPLNKLLHSHHMKAHRMKEADKVMVKNACMAYGVAQADSKRHLELMVVHPPGKRFCDKDAYWKSLLDALVPCGAIKNDSHLWVSYDAPEFVRGETLRTIITITDL